MQGLEGTGFLRELLVTLTQRGLGVLPAREVASSTLELILQHHPDLSVSPPPDYELARLLKISPRSLEDTSMMSIFPTSQLITMFLNKVSGIV